MRRVQPIAPLGASTARRDADGLEERLEPVADQCRVETETCDDFGVGRPWQCEKRRVDRDLGGFPWG